MHTGQRGHAHITGGFGLGDGELEGDRSRGVVAGLALCPTEAGHLVRLGLAEAEASRRLRGPTDVQDGVVEAVLDAGQLAPLCLEADIEPGVIDALEPVRDLVERLDAALLVAGGDGRARREDPVRGLIPRPVELPVEGVAAIGQRERLAEEAIVRDDVRQVVAAAGLQLDVGDLVRQSLGRLDVLASEVELTDRCFDPRHEERARRLGPARGRGRRTPRGRRGSAVRLGCRPARPRPTRTR